VFLRQEIGRGKAFDHAHDVLAARARVARLSTKSVLRINEKGE
jgi:hypothetical protein